MLALESIGLRLIKENVMGSNRTFYCMDCEKQIPWKEVAYMIHDQAVCKTCQRTLEELAKEAKLKREKIKDCLLTNEEE